MRLRNIAVTGLYGIFDHEIPMDKPEGVTIIHGPNGYGKTVMLKMISAACEGDAEIFKSIPFEEFKIEFADGSTWRAVRQLKKSTESGASVNVRIVTTSAEGTVTEVQPDLEEEIPGQYLDLMDSGVPGPYQRSGKGWRDDQGRYYSVQQIIKMFPGAEAQLPPSARRQLRSRRAWDLKLDVFVVEANRLESSRQFEADEPRVRRALMSSAVSEPPRSLRVQQYSRDVVQRIRSVLADYAKSSQERDRTFPERLVQFVRQEKKMLGAREILEQMQDLEKKRQRLITLGFLDPETGLRDLTEEDIHKAQEALTIYVGDVHQKLGAFDEMAQRVGKLIDIINARFEYKRLKIHRERGFCVVSHKGAPIQLSDLSSGEQHELVVLYELLFRTPKHGLILVDEPEISLHVAWQSRFLADLIDIVKLNDAYAVVATHSPVVIGSQWNLTEQLKGPPVGEEPEPAREMQAEVS